MTCIDLGCGTNKIAGWDGIDIRAFPGVDHVVNLEVARLPYESESVAQANASHVLEHIFNLIGLMNEVWRVLMPGGLFHIEVPLFPDAGSIKDPTHVRFFIPESFDYFDEAWDYPDQPEYGIKRYRVREKRIAGKEPYRTLQVLLQKPREDVLDQ